MNTSQGQVVRPANDGTPLTSAVANLTDLAEGAMKMVKVDGHRALSIRQHAGDSDVWGQTFRKGTGTHTVEIVKNGVSQRTYKVHTH